MQRFGPRDPNHGRVPWEDELVSVPIMLPSWLVVLLRQNDAPSHIDIAQVEDFRQSTTEEITKVQQRTKYFKEKEIRLQKQLNACDVVMSPLRCIPDHIIRQIVTSEPLLPDPESATDPRTHTPSILAQVSKMWRSVVQSIPSLWNNIRFDTMIWNDRSFHPLSERITRFCVLSRHLKFAINMDETIYSPQDREHTIFDKRQEDPLRAIQRSSSAGYSESGLAFPRILYHLLGTWAYRHSLFDLNLNVAHPEIILIFLKAIAAQRLPFPAVNSITILCWKSDGGGRHPINNEVDVYGVLSMLPKLSGLWLFERYGRYSCLYRNPSKGHSPALHNGLKHFYLQPIISFGDWIKILAHWPCLRAVSCNVLAPTGTMAAPQRIVHHHIKHLVLQVERPSLSLETLWLQPFFPLFKASLPSLEVLILYFANRGIGDLNFLATDFGQAFPSLTHLRIYVEWGQFHLFENLSLYLLSLPIEATLTILIRTGDIVQLVDLLPLIAHNLLQPSHVCFVFDSLSSQPSPFWSGDLVDDFTCLIIECCQSRPPKSTTIRYEYLSSDYYQDGEDEVDSEDWSDSDSESEQANIKNQNRIYKGRRNLERMLACFRALQTQLGEETVEVVCIERTGSDDFERRQQKSPLQWLSPSLKQFRERYF